MGGRRKNKGSQQNGHYLGFGQNAGRLHPEQTHSQNSSSTSVQQREQNTSCENSGTELNVPRQQNHRSSQNMKAVAYGHQSDKYDDKARSKSGIQHDVTDQRTADSHQNTNRDTKNEYHDISKDVSQSHRSELWNYYDVRSENTKICQDRNYLQDSHYWQDGHERERYQGSQYHKQNSYHYENPSQKPNPEGKVGIRTMSCVVCTSEYNAKDRKPRNLKCGHSVCSLCVLQLIQQLSIICPHCRMKTSSVYSLENLSVNYSLLQLLEELSQNSAMAMNSTPSGSKTQAMKALAPPKQEKSPHCSRCFEIGAPIESHCATCEQWVCIDCGRIDHNSDACILTPYKETLSQIIQAKKSMAENAHQSLKKSSSEAKNYCDILTTCLIIVETTFDCIKKEHKRFGKILEDSKQVETDLQLSVADMLKAKTLKEKLPIFKKVDESVNYTQEWASSVISSHRNDRVKKLSKELLCTTVEIHSASTGNESSSGILAMHTINNTEMFSKLMCEGGRIHVFSLVQTAPPSGSHALPLESIKSCMDSASALTFLDLSWGGSHGRVYIRLTGDSVRGRQFLILCTGEEGPSFRNTHFHRVWWKGLPGEHVWGGDYDQSDGSGGTQVKNADVNEMPSEAGRKLPITAGLVAGRYEKKNISSVFRIFTKDAKDVVEEAAFGQVEYGLQFVDDAINHNNIQDVIISDCGIVIEL